MIKVAFILIFNRGNLPLNCLIDATKLENLSKIINLDLEYQLIA